jgi:hypothetical protein
MPFTNVLCWSLECKCEAGGNARTIPTAHKHLVIYQPIAVHQCSERDAAAR